MSSRAYLGLVLVASAGLAGCGTYMEAKEATRAGGTIDQQKAAANQQLAAAKATNTRLTDEQLNREREIERMEKRIQASQTELSKQNQALADALRTRQITQARHDQLKRDLNGIQADMQNVELQNKMDKGSKPDPAGQAEKEKKLAALEQRKRELEAAMGTLVRR